MDNNKNNSVQEEVLFNVTKNENSLINNFSNASKNVGEETLFSSSSENIDYIEPQKPSKINFSSLDTGIFEENISFSEPKNNKNTYSQSLFNMEDENGSNIIEESLSYSEPTHKEGIKEEVLFKDNFEELTPISPEFNVDRSNVAEEKLFDDFTDYTEPKKVYEDKCFAKKMLETDQEIIDNYCILKNEILKYKNVKSRISTNYDSFNIGRTKLFKLSTSGKSLKLYLNLDYSQVESRLKAKDVSNVNSYKDVPVFLRIKSNRAMKNAKYLISKVAERFSLKENKKFEVVDCLTSLKTYSDN